MHRLLSISISSVSTALTKENFRWPVLLRQGEHTAKARGSALPAGPHCDGGFFAWYTQARQKTSEQRTIRFPA